MYAYVDNKCSWGYMLVCDSCRTRAPLHVDISRPIVNPPRCGTRQRCEICSKFSYVQTAFDSNYKMRDLLIYVQALEKIASVAQERYNQLLDIHRTAKSNEEVAELVRQCVKEWNNVEQQTIPV